MATRLRAIGAHLVAAQAVDDHLANDEALSLLDDAQMAQFVEHGWDVAHCFLLALGSFASPHFCLTFCSLCFFASPHFDVATLVQVEQLCSVLLCFARFASLPPRFSPSFRITFTSPLLSFFRYVLLPLDELSDEFHSDLYRKCQGRFEETGGKNGKEIFKEIPELNKILTSKTLQGGLTSVLGKDYTMHPARHMHVSGNNDGGFHKDGGHCSIRHHRQRWAMAMYLVRQT
jgi:hypothetical protein